MFQMFASALFGDEAEEELSLRSRNGDGKEEEDDEEDWILVNYLADARSGSTAGPEEEEEEEEEEDLVMIPSPMASPPIRYASCTSLNSTADGGEEEEEEGEEEEEEEEEGGFLRLDACSLEESWFVTPPPCFTGRGVQPALLEASPLENLLIEHPSMSVYAHRSPPRTPRTPRTPQDPRSLDLDRGRLPGNAHGALTPSPGKEKGRRTLDGPRHRPEVASVPRRSSLHSACYAAALSSRSSGLQQRGGQRGPPLTRNALRRLNLLRPPKGSSAHLHQPSQRHLNF
ncbi:Tumor protein p53-inducible nuclear protein 1 [Liparis tanakae]|uniref:Tumor protein p53-inducible nuclear protein 1 n=1 Tax=Liparis tanakae TaxID=230148 RepID=A0A4Z2FBT0_9TELE|nr:Tumor protein p53-inducible nuclear protein 1 [Liparis tanakae]